MTATPTASSTAVATETALPVVEVHNEPRTVQGGRAAPCDLQINLKKITPRCEILSSVSSAGATVVYTIVYPEPLSAMEIFTDTADFRGHSLHIFNVPYVPPVGVAHGAPSTVANVTVRASTAGGTPLAPAKTRFTVIR